MYPDVFVSSNCVSWDLSYLASAKSVNATAGMLRTVIFNQKDTKSSLSGCCRFFQFRRLFGSTRFTAVYAFQYSEKVQIPIAGNIHQVYTGGTRPSQTYKTMYYRHPFKLFIPKFQFIAKYFQFIPKVRVNNAIYYRISKIVYKIWIHNKE